jgi:hypothetical protein
VDNVFNAAGSEAMEEPALIEGSDDLRVGCALLLRSDDEADLLWRVLASAHHFDEHEED